MSPALPPRVIQIRQQALAKLLLYAARCPVEIGGLGYVVEDGGGLLIRDPFLLSQKVSASDTELDADALCEFLDRLVREEGDVRSVRLWWHSHADMDVIWSETDAATIEHLPGDFWVAVLVNRRGEVRCRLDAFVPARQSWEVPLVEIPDAEPGDPEALRVAIDREILEKVRVVVMPDAVDMGGVTGRVTEYPISLVLEPPQARPKGGGAQRRK